MMEQFNHGNIERLIVNTVSMLCKNSISYSSKLRIQGTLGITVDSASVVLIQLNECFERDAEGSHRSVSAPDGRGAAGGILASSYSAADVKRPRMSVVQCTRRPVGRVRTRVPAPPVRRVRSGQIVTATKPSAQHARQQLAFPSPNQVALMKPADRLQHPSVQHVSPSLSMSSQFHAGHVSASNIETSQPLPAKSEVEDEWKQSTNIKYPVSSDVICVESDDETESSVRTKSAANSSRLNTVSVKPEGQSQDALQMIVDRALLAARATNPGMAELPLSDIATSSRKSSSSGLVVDGTSMQYGDGSLVHADVKPTVESTDMVQQQWTPSKQLLLSSTKMLPSTAAGVKTEVAPQSPVFGCSNPRRPGSASKVLSSRDATSWTSVTETTFICTTASCAKRFTTKRALVRHQKDKHGLVTSQMLSAGGLMETDSDTANDVPY